MYFGMKSYLKSNCNHTAKQSRSSFQHQKKTKQAGAGMQVADGGHAPWMIQ
jgi:hypothetical protein